jgi:hypothetical protein
MSERAWLGKAIAGCSEDPVNWLALADWYEEQGHPLVHVTRGVANLLQQDRSGFCLMHRDNPRFWACHTEHLGEFTGNDLLRFQGQMLSAHLSNSTVSP